MDPNANLDEQRELVKTLLAGEDYLDSGDAVRLAELVQSMDEWLRNGGFLPHWWERSPVRDVTARRCDCVDLGCPHYDTRDPDSVARCAAGATQVLVFHGRPDGQEYCLECAKNAAETLENVSYVEL